MSATDHLQPQQLSMFMPAQQIFDTHELADARSQTEVSKRRIIDSKRRENEKYGDPDMGEPIVVHHGEDLAYPFSKTPQVFDGHHRLAKGMQTNAEIPMQHIDHVNWWTT